MILPTKHIPARDSLLAVGSLLLENLGRARTITGLWETVRARGEVSPYGRFILALDLLYAVGAIEIRDGMISRGEQ